MNTKQLAKNQALQTSKSEVAFPSNTDVRMKTLQHFRYS